MATITAATTRSSGPTAAAMKRGITSQTEALNCKTAFYTIHNIMDLVCKLGECLAAS